MKTTVKLSPLLALIMKPTDDGFSVAFSVVRGGKIDFHVDLCPDECGALIFGLECANEARKKAAQHACTDEAFAARLQAATRTYDKQPMEGGVRCHGDGCAGGQLPCPSPEACFV